MPRLVFSKTDDAIWMSHLDLMRLFQRAFKRAGLPLTHTQGYNPRPSVSIALPLSVGVESVCELLDFDLEGEKIPCDEIVRRLNAVLVKGISVLDCKEDCRKIRDIAFLDCMLTMEYDRDITEEALLTITELFQRDSVLLEKKSKNGLSEQDIIPMIRNFQVNKVDDHTIMIHSRICCQNPSLNPMQIAAAIERYAPACKPDHVRCRRLEIYDTKETVFR